MSRRYKIKLESKIESAYKRMELLTAYQEIQRSRDFLSRMRKLYPDNKNYRQAYHPMAKQIANYRIMFSQQCITTLNLKLFTKNGVFEAKSELNNNTKKQVTKRLLSSTIDQLRRVRYQRQNKTDSYTVAGVYATFKNGKVYTRSGSILEAYKRKVTEIIFKDKRPITKENHIGVEIEFYIPQGLERDDLAREFAETQLGQYVTLKDDGSINCDEDNGDTSFELAICAPESKIEQVVNESVQVLEQYDAEVNSSCGLHIHLDMRSRPVNVVYNRLVAAQKYLFQLVPKSRRSNSYTQLTPKIKMEEVSGRYYAINPEAYKKYKTLEVRLHSGTVDAAKINNWIALLLTVISRGVVKGPNQHIVNWLKALKVSPQLLKYYTERAKKFTTAWEEPEHQDLPVEHDSGNECPECDDNDYCSQCSECHSCGHSS
jgi:hypothetical protein